MLNRIPFLSLSAVTLVMTVGCTNLPTTPEEVRQDMAQRDPRSAHLLKAMNDPNTTELQKEVIKAVLDYRAKLIHSHQTCPGYSCASQITENKEHLLESAIENNSTEILRSTLADVRLPLSSWDRLKLNKLLSKEMQKGEACDEARVEALADLGAIVDVSHIKIWKDTYLFCNAGLAKALNPYYFDYQKDREVLLGYLMALQTAFNDATTGWHSSQIQILNGKDKSDLQDPDEYAKILKRYEQLVRSALHMRTITSVTASHYTEAGFKDLQTYFAAYHIVLGPKLQESIAGARQKWHPKDKRTSVYNRLIKDIGQTYTRVTSEVFGRSKLTAAK